MDITSWLILIVAAAIAIAALQLLHVSAKKKSLEETINSLTDVEFTQKVMSEDGSTGIALDEKNQKIAIVSSTDPRPTVASYSYRDILSVEIFVDGSAVTKTSRTSQLGGALLGGLALGGVGAIIGGLSGSSKTSQKANRIDVRITVNDKENPVHDINFMNIEAKEGGFVYNQAMKTARHWHGLVTVLIKEADAEDEATSSTSNYKLQYSTADELFKLSDLHSKGIISKDEFDSEKQKILNQSNPSE